MEASHDVVCMTTFNSVVEIDSVEFIRYLMREGLAEVTAHLYARDASKFLSWLQNHAGYSWGGDAKGWIVLYRDELVAAGFSDGTINRRLAATKWVSRWLAGNNALENDAGVTVSYVHRRQRRQRPALGEFQIDMLLASCRQRRHPRRSIAAFQIILHTALRVEQIVGLTFSDLHLSPGKSTIILRRGDREQQIPLPKVVREALDDYITGERRDALTDHVFVSQRGGQLAAVSLRQQLRRCLRAAGLDGVSLQDLRSVFAQDYLLAHPGDVPGVARLLEIRDWNALKSYLIDEEAQ